MELTERMAIARSIKRLRVDDGLSQEALAHKIKSSRSTIFSLEKGEANVGFDVIEALASYFQMSVYELITSGYANQDFRDLTVAENHQAFVKNIKKLMLSKNMKPAQLAKACEIELNTVYSWLSAQRAPKRAKIRLIAKALGVDEAELYARERLVELSDELKPTRELVQTQMTGELLEVIRMLKSLDSKLNMIDERMVRGLAAIEAMVKQRK